VVDGYADLDPGGRPGLGAHARAEFGIPVIRGGQVQVPHRYPRGAGGARVLGTPTVRHGGRAARSRASALVWRMAGRYWLPDALRRADTLARTGPPAATMTDRQPD
jgi:deoxyribonuclease V